MAKREEEAVYEVARNTLKNVGIGVRRGVEMDLEGFKKALERVFTANGEWGELRDYVKQVIEAAGGGGWSRTSHIGPRIQSWRGGLANGLGDAAD